MNPHRRSVLGMLASAAPAALAALAALVAPPGAGPLSAQVRPGIEVLLSDSTHLIAGGRLGLLTNQTGVDRRGRRDSDLLRARGYRLVALFSPEHGWRGLEDHPGLPDGTDSASGLPIYSLYGGTPLSGLTALDSLDVVLIDLQDVGARYYTYPASAAQLMRAAARRGKRVIVLDRPDPIGGVLVQGDVRARAGDPDSEPVGFLPVPMRHGMTLGELMRFANDVLGFHADLTVVPAAGWRRDRYYDATGLPWVRPSPNMPDLESALDYPGTCLFEGTNLSVGRGTAFAFQVIGAPWLDPAAVLRRLRPMREALRGVELAATTFTPHAPSDGKDDGVALPGLRLRVTDRRRYDPTKTAVALLVALRAVAPDSLRIDAPRFDRLAAGPGLREAIAAGRSAAAIWRSWEPALARFRRARTRALIY